MFLFDISFLSNNRLSWHWDNLQPRNIEGASMNIKKGMTDRSLPRYV